MVSDLIMVDNMMIKENMCYWSIDSISVLSIANLSLWKQIYTSDEQISSINKQNRPIDSKPVLTRANLF